MGEFLGEPDPTPAAAPVERIHSWGLPLAFLVALGVWTVGGLWLRWYCLPHIRDGYAWRGPTADIKRPAAMNFMDPEQQGTLTWPRLLAGPCLLIALAIAAKLGHWAREETGRHVLTGLYLLIAAGGILLLLPVFGELVMWGRDGG